jgi:hypothetical protein
MSQNQNINVRLGIDVCREDFIQNFYRHYDKIINAPLWDSPVQYRRGVLSEF